ncbi:hypothetical protein ACRC7T_13825 [Segnochrobactraceae bacterium EtOH-i3]
MMTMNIATMMPSVIGDPTYQLDYAALVAAGVVVPETDPVAREEYLFDVAGAAALRDRRSGYLLKQGPLAVAPPTILADRVTVDGEYGGLICHTADQAAMTVGLVFQRPVGTLTGALHLIGTDTGVAGNSGWGIYIVDSGALTLSIRPGTGDPGIISATVNAALPKGAWGFAAAVLSDESSTIYLGAGGSLIKAPAAGVTRVLAGAVTIGKAVNLGSSYGSDALSVRRAIISHDALGDADVLALYKRAGVICARRNWALV